MSIPSLLVISLALLLALVDATLLQTGDVHGGSDTSCSVGRNPRKRNRLSLSPLTLAEPSQDVHGLSKESEVPQLNARSMARILEYFPVVEIIKMRLVNHAWSVYSLTPSNFRLPVGRFGGRLRYENFMTLLKVTLKDPKRMSVQLWRDLSLQDKIDTTQVKALTGLLRVLYGIGHKEGFTFLVTNYFNGERKAWDLHKDAELGVPALLVNPASLTPVNLWVKAMEGDEAFVEAALPTLDSEKRSSIVQFCQAYNSLDSMTKAPDNPDKSRQIFNLLRQLCAHVGQDFGYRQASNGMSRMSNLPQLQLILSNLDEEEKPRYHSLWMQRELTNAAFDYLLQYLGSHSMPPDHLNFVVSCGNVLVLEHMIDSGKYFPEIFSLEQVKKASKVAKEHRTLASLIRITTLYGEPAYDVQVAKAIYYAFTKGGFKGKFPEGFNVWNKKHVMAFARGPFSQWLNSVYHKTRNEIVEREGIGEGLKKLGILTQ